MLFVFEVRNGAVSSEVECRTVVNADGVTASWSVGSHGFGCDRTTCCVWVGEFRCLDFLYRINWTYADDVVVVTAYSSGSGWLVLSHSGADEEFVIDRMASCYSVVCSGSVMIVHVDVVVVLAVMGKWSLLVWSCVSGPCPVYLMPCEGHEVPSGT